MSEKMSPEVMAMGQVESALTGLDDEVRQRVLAWAGARFGITVAGAGGTHIGGAGTESSPGANGEFADLATLYEAAGPTTDADKALVTAYWVQVLGGQTDFESAAVNIELKNLGHGIGNITRAFNALKAQKPALVVQVRKDGKTRQARKKYKVTAEGTKAVQQMISGE